MDDSPGELYINDVKVGNVTSSDFMIGQQPQAKFEIVIDTGKAIARKVRLNGVELPNVHDLTVEYSPHGARTVIVEILATDVIEVPE